MNRLLLLYRRMPMVCEALVAAVLCAVFVGAQVFPLSRLPYPGGDTFQMVWNLFSVTESLLAGRNPLWTDLVFWPVGGNLATHTLASGFAPLALAVRAVLGGGPDYAVAAFNLAVFLSFLATLTFTLAALRRLGFSLAAAVVPALCAAFASFYGLHVPHLNLVSAFVVPLGFILVHDTLCRPAPGRAVLAAACLGWMLYVTEMAAFLSVFLGAGVLALAPARRRLAGVVRELGAGWTLAAAGAFAAVAAPFVLMWLSSDALRPDAGDSSPFSANLLAFVVPGHFRAPTYGEGFAPWNAWMAGVGGFEAFLGYPFLILAAIGAAVAWRDRAVRWAVVLALVFAVLCLGPTLKVGAADTGLPLPYALLQRVPPFSMGRTPVRLVVFVLFVLTVPAAAGVRFLLADRRAGRLALGGALALWALAEARYPTPPRGPLPRMAAGVLPDGPVLVLPLRINDGRGLALQLSHRQPISSAYLARLSQRHIDLTYERERAILAGPESVCAYARSTGFRSILITGPMPDGYEAGLSGCAVPVFHP